MVQSLGMYLYNKKVHVNKIFNLFIYHIFRQVKPEGYHGTVCWNYIRFWQSSIIINASKSIQLAEQQKN